MKVYIQSKSGNYNTVIHTSYEKIEDVFVWLREKGGYIVNKGRTGDKKRYVVPFEEIEFIREATEDNK